MYYIWFSQSFMIFLGLNHRRRAVGCNICRFVSRPCTHSWSFWERLTEPLTPTFCKIYLLYQRDTNSWLIEGLWIAGRISTSFRYQIQMDMFTHGTKIDFGTRFRVLLPLPFLIDSFLLFFDCSGTKIAWKWALMRDAGALTWIGTVTPLNLKAHQCLIDCRNWVC